MFTNHGLPSYFTTLHILFGYLYPDLVEAQFRQPNHQNSNNTVVGAPSEDLAPAEDPKQEPKDAPDASAGIINGRAAATLIRVASVAGAAESESSVSSELPNSKPPKEHKKKKKKEKSGSGRA